MRLRVVTDQPETNQPHSYRAYRVSAGRRISASPIILEASGDEDAIAQARQLVDRVGMKVWDRARCVIVLPPRKNDLADG